MLKPNATLMRIWFDRTAIVVKLDQNLVTVGGVLRSIQWALLWLVSVRVLAIDLEVYHRLRPAFADVL